MFQINKKLVHKTIYLSLILQIITTAISLRGFSIKLNKQDSVLQDILKLETGVQIVEAFVYLWITYSLNNFDTNTPSGLRSFDDNSNTSAHN